MGLEARSLKITGMEMIVNMVSHGFLNIYIYIFHELVAIQVGRGISISRFFSLRGVRFSSLSSSRSSRAERSVSNCRLLTRLLEALLKL